jgi:hypothetical protein
MRIAIGLILLASMSVATAADMTIGAGGQLILGGFDPATRGDAAQGAIALEHAIASFKKVGATSNEVYVRWNLCETAPGKWDFSVYDRYVAIYKEYRIKWVPFLICGSPYSLPDWYYKNPGSQGYICLEHGEESDVQSLWNPAMREHAARFIKAFCERYRDGGEKGGTIEAILLGVSGNYGEAIYPVTGNDWTADVHGPYHSHPGFWAGDPYAVKNFHAWVRKKYGTYEKLRDAWGDNAITFNDVTPFLRKNAPGKGDRAWIDFVDWYQQSMTDYASFWLHETRKNFPKGDIYLCTGGHAPPPHGSDFAEQARVAAEIGGGVRITNEASDYALNFSLTRWVASGCRQYGAYFSFEPAGPVDAGGVVARVYNATASGARGLHYYYGNLFDSQPATDNFLREGPQFLQRKPIVEIAVFYPSTHIKLHGQDFIDPCARPLRDRFDFGYMSEKQITDGGLKSIKALILMRGDVMEKSTWEAIGTWLRGGGLLIRAQGKEPLHDVEGNPLKAPDPLGSGAVMSVEADGKSEKFRQFASDVLSKAPELSPQSRAMVAADGKEDKNFVTVIAPDQLLWLDAADGKISATAISAASSR